MISFSLSPTQDLLLTWLDPANSLANRKIERVTQLLGWRPDERIPGAFHTPLAFGWRPDATIRLTPEGVCEVTFPLAPQLDSGSAQVWSIGSYAEIVSADLTDLFGPARQRHNADGEAVSTWTSSDGLYRITVTTTDDHLDVRLRRPIHAQSILGKYRSPSLASTKKATVERLQNIAIFIGIVAIVVFAPLVAVLGTIVVALFPFVVYSAGYSLTFIIPLTIALLVGYVYTMRWYFDRLRPVWSFIRSR